MTPRLTLDPRGAVVVIADPTHHTMILVAQLEAAMMGRCSVCEAPTARESLDASARCIECQP